MINKLKFLTVFPMVIIFSLFLFFLFNALRDLSELTDLKKNVQNIGTLTALINELQKERGISSGFIASDAKEYRENLLMQQQKTDTIFQKFPNEKLQKKFLELRETRQAILQLKFSTVEAFDFYSNLIKVMQKQYLNMSLNIEDLHVRNQLNAYVHLSLMKEALGQIRGSFNGIFSSHTMNYALLYRAVHAKGVYDSSLSSFETVSSLEVLKKMHQVSSTNDYKWVENIIKFYSQPLQKTIIEDPKEWFVKSTHIIEQLYLIEKYYLQSIQKYTEKKSHDTSLQLIINTLAFIFVVILVFRLGFKIKNDIMNNIALLNEYKNAVDRSSIVSKTNKKGIITYVNERFCSISGYKAEELIGKAHNIVRHPDMPKSAFKDMWSTIMRKEAWSGIVKNVKKDGSSYTVEATINPILNHEGEIEEFIAIRNDITEVIELHEELEKTQEDLIFRMGEIGETRSMETGAHVRRVAKYTELLARYSGLSEKEIMHVVSASPMHDIGKVAIPDNILNKQGKLTAQEWDIMKTHSQIGYELFQNSHRPLLQTAAIIAHEHHEKYNGSGYPRGLKGKDIHIYGRITALADVFDALGSDRCYKKAWSDERIFKLLKDERGKHFDPKLVDIFFEHLDEFLEIRDIYNDKSSFMANH